MERAVTDLPEPRLADEREGLAGVEVEADAADGLGALAALHEADREVADREERVGQGEHAGVLHARRTAVRTRAQRAHLVDTEGFCFPALTSSETRAQAAADDRGHRKVFRGSKASRTPSKMKTSSDSMIAKVKKAVKPSQGALRRFLPCSASSPSEG